jgi:putative transposase
MSRLRRLALCDRYFFVTCRVHASRRGLSESELAILARAIRERCAAMPFVLAAWVLLPDHWHAMIFARCPLTVSRVMEAIKVSATKLINRSRGERGVLFQGRFFERALRTVKEYHEKVEYIHRNPVTEGLAARPKDWQWSSVHDFTGSINQRLSTGSPVPVDRILLPSDERARI